MAGGSVLRRGYDLVALFALLHMAALVGVGVFLVGTGRLDRAKVQRIAKVVRGEDEAPDDQDPDQLASTIVEPEARPPVESETEREIVRREGDRVKVELDQRLATINRLMLRLSTKRDAFRREVAENATRQAETEKVGRHEGFKKQLAYIESLKPKVAVKHLLAIPDPDDAATFLLQMDERKGKKIIEAAKTGVQLVKMQDILRRVAKVAPDKSLALNDEASR
ncbi:MAG: hypothetical protein ACE5E6_04115 [Phycisphaerae bacterium]